LLALDEVGQVANAARQAIELGDNDALNGSGSNLLDDRTDSGAFKALGALAGAALYI
jgi:hypothetical protein